MRIPTRIGWTRLLALHVFAFVAATAAAQPALDLEDGRGSAVIVDATKTDSLDTATPGTPHQYVITLEADPISTSSNLTVVDTLPGALLEPSWTCTATPGSSCTASGDGDINDAVFLAANGTLTYIVSSTIDPAAFGTLSNTVTVQGTDSPTTATDTTQLQASGTLIITKTDNQDTALPGGEISYSIVVANQGPSAAVGAIVQDSIPTEIENAMWTCIPSAGSTCQSPMGFTDLDECFDIAAGGQVEFQIVGTIADDAAGTITNTADLRLPAGFGAPDVIQASDSTRILTPLEVPNLGSLGLGFFALLLSGVALFWLVRRA